MHAQTLFEQQLSHTLVETALSGLGPVVRGKVRDWYQLPAAMVLVTTDRLSAFDRVLTTIPFKGQLLNQLAAFWFEKTSDLIPNHVLEVPDPNVLVARRCQPLPVEVVVRGHLAGSLWRDYQAGVANRLYGLELEPGLRRDSRFQRPLITPSTKAEAGAHDAPLRESDIVAHGLVEAAIWQRVRAVALQLFARGQQWADSRGLILVDTKYEFGIDLQDQQLRLIDEIHTPDSSRYWIADGSEDRQQHGEPQRMLDKENIRQWLVNQRGFAGDGPTPTIPDDERVRLGLTYLDAFERITGTTPHLEVGPPQPRIQAALQKLKSLAR